MCDQIHVCQRTAKLLAQVYPFRANHSFYEHFEKRTGRFILTNVSLKSQKTAICINIINTGSATWRDSGTETSNQLNLSSPPFEISAETACISYDFANFLGTHFEIIRSVLPDTAFNSSNQASIGGISQLSSDMTKILSGLQDHCEEVSGIWKSLNRSIDTPIYEMRKQKRPLQLMEGESLSEDGRKVLKAFPDSVEIYGNIPELTLFGTENENRCKERPNKRDAVLRYFMQQKPLNPLGGKHELHCVAHELKPLNIANGLRWNCSGNPRTDSIDLLLSYNGCPVLTEVKMAGDSFVSVAIVQLLYYAAVLASVNQKSRIHRSFPNAGNGKMLLAVIAENRHTNRTEQTRFDNDLQSVRNFLDLKDTREVLGKYFGGAFILVVEEFEKNSFRIYDDRESFIDWANSD